MARTRIGVLLASVVFMAVMTMLWNYESMSSQVPAQDLAPVRSQKHPPVTSAESIERTSPSAHENATPKTSLSSEANNLLHEEFGRFFTVGERKGRTAGMLEELQCPQLQDALEKTFRANLTWMFDSTTLGLEKSKRRAFMIDEPASDEMFGPYVDLDTLCALPSRAAAVKHYGILPAFLDVPIDEGGGWRGCESFICPKDGPYEGWCDRMLFSMYLLVRQMVEIFGMSWWAEGGYLLYSVRDSMDGIPTDRDVDLVLNARDALYFTRGAGRKTVNSLGFHVHVDSWYHDVRLCFTKGSTLVPDEIKTGYPPEDQFFRPPLYVDLQPLGVKPKTNSIFLSGFYGDCPLDYCETDIYPTITTRLAGHTVRGPRRALKYLTYLYGPRWRDKVGKYWDAGSYPCGRNGGWSSGIPDFE